MLGQILDGPIRFTPIDEPTRRGYRFEGAVHIGNAISGAITDGKLTRRIDRRGAGKEHVEQSLLRAELCRVGADCGPARPSTSSANAWDTRRCQ